MKIFYTQNLAAGYKYMTVNKFIYRVGKGDGKDKVPIFVISMLADHRSKQNTVSIFAIRNSGPGVKLDAFNFGGYDNWFLIFPDPQFLHSIMLTYPSAFARHIFLD